MKRFLKASGLALGVLLACLAGLYAWASWGSARLLGQTLIVHQAAFPIPFPLPQHEVDSLGLDPAEADALAFERARERGRHLITARYSCTECHGADFGGGVMVDAPVMARLLGPNLTAGAGSKTLGYTPADWDRVVRHGVLPDGRPATMPSEDFQLMSDQELSDVVVYINGLPPIDAEVPLPVFGPLGKVLLATGRLPLSATLIASHDAPHAPLPPEPEPSAAFGRHLAGVCTGCHGADLAGGPIAGGDPSWPAARNLTPHEAALGPWTYEEFVAAMRDGQRPDGAAVLPPMTIVAPFARNMTEVELEALWLYLRSLPPLG